MKLGVSGVHLSGFLVFGLFAAWLVFETELHADSRYLAFALCFAAVLALTVLVRTMLSRWLIGVSTVMGTLAMAGYLAEARRALLRAIGAASEHGLVLAE